MVKADIIVFDMDGVLVDVKASYRDCIIAVVEQITGKTVTHGEIQAYKNRGGFNNDWLLSQTLCRAYGVEMEYGEIVRIFNELFFGTYMQREKWLPVDGLIERLSSRHPLYIFTGRLNEEAQITLRRFNASQYFTGVLGDDDVARPKPDPDGLLQIGRLNPAKRILYLGDTVDDRRASEAAGVPFVGVGPHAGAEIVIEEINQLEALLA